MNFLNREQLEPVFRDKSVAIVGSGPGVLENVIGVIDAHEVVVRVNNYKLFNQTGKRTDVFYSFFGNSIRKKSVDLRRDGVRVCMCKCPDAKFIESEWHRANNRMIGVDFRWIYKAREAWWFCPTWVPSVEEFRAHFDLLGGHVPTTGFAAVLDVLSFRPASVYLTGFDFFLSGLHNVNDVWRPGDPQDPIGHDPLAEREWIAANLSRFPITLDDTARAALEGKCKYKTRRQLAKPKRLERTHVVIR